MDGEADRFAELWGELTMESPLGVLKNHLCVGAVAWRPDSEGVLYTVSQGIRPQQLRLETSPLLPVLTEPARDVLSFLDEQPIQAVAWRAPAWIYLSYILVGLTALRRRMPARLLPLALLLSLQLTRVVLNVAQDHALHIPLGPLRAVMSLSLATIRPGEHQ